MESVFDEYRDNPEACRRLNDYLAQFSEPCPICGRKCAGRCERVEQDERNAAYYEKERQQMSGFSIHKASRSK